MPGRATIIAFKDPVELSANIDHIGNTRRNCNGSWNCSLREQAGQCTPGGSTVLALPYACWPPYVKDALIHWMNRYRKDLLARRFWQ